jgi:two-component system, cell cycle response regulator
MAVPPPNTVRISERLTPLSGIAAISEDGDVRVSGVDDRRISAWSRFWRVTDPALRDAGIRGERTIAKFRLVAILLLFVIPLRAVMMRPDLQENFVGLFISGCGVAAGLFFLWLTHRDVVHSWTGFAASLLDVTWVSAGLATFIAMGMPQIAVNSRVIFEVYFLCLAITCLRYDRRICIVTGVTAMVQYAFVVWWASGTVNAQNEWLDTGYGRFDPYDQAGRLGLLLVMTIVSFTIVLRVQQLRVLSVRDRLTGLMIRGYFDERLGEAFERARRTREPIAVAMIDLDYFKSFNDRFGHAVGDLVLASVSRAVKELVRTEDVVGRYGGEEIIVMLPGLTLDRAAERMEHIRRAISQVRVELEGGVPLSETPQADLFVEQEAGPESSVLTASIGVASWPEDRGDTVEALVYRADARLLTAKSTGRNRVVSQAGTTDEFAVLTVV